MKPCSGFMHQLLKHVQQADKYIGGKLKTPNAYVDKDFGTTCYIMSYVNNAVSYY